jgi:glycosyltransferase involved in cell wall biosynthesis
LYEPFGIVALEAMAAGCPTVVAASGGLTETVTHGYDGLLVPPGDPDALAQAVIHLLDDSALAIRLGKNAQRTVREKYAWSDIAKATLAVYHDTIQQFLAAR